MLEDSNNNKHQLLKEKSKKPNPKLCIKENEIVENIKKSIYTDSLYDSAPENDNQTQMIEDISVSVENIEHNRINVNSIINKPKHNRTINSTATRKVKEITKIELGKD